TDNPRSDDGYVINSTAEHVRDFVAALALPPVHIVGHSRGAYTACRFALEHAEKVKTLILVDSSTLMSYDSPFYERLEAQLSDIDNLEEHYRYMIRAHSWRGHHISARWIEGMAKIHSLPKTREASAKMGWGEYSGGGSAFRAGSAIGRRFFTDLAER